MAGQSALHKRAVKTDPACLGCRCFGSVRGTLQEDKRGATLATSLKVPSRDAKRRWIASRRSDWRSYGMLHRKKQGGAELTGKAAAIAPGGRLVFALCVATPLAGSRPQRTREPAGSVEQSRFAPSKELAAPKQKDKFYELGSRRRNSVILGFRPRTHRAADTNRRMGPRDKPEDDTCGCGASGALPTPCSSKFSMSQRLRLTAMLKTLSAHKSPRTAHICVRSQRWRAG